MNLLYETDEIEIFSFFAFVVPDTLPIIPYPQKNMGPPIPYPPERTQDQRPGKDLAPEIMTYACENITFPQLRWRAVKVKIRTSFMLKNILQSRWFIQRDNRHYLTLLMTLLLNSIGLLCLCLWKFRVTRASTPIDT